MATIMIVGRQLAASGLLNQALQSEGHRPILVESGIDERLRLARQNGAPDLFLLGSQEADEPDSCILCRSIRSDPRLYASGVIIYSGLDADENRVEALRAGADDFVSSSCSLEELLCRIRSILRRAADRNVSESAIVAERPAPDSPRKPPKGSAKLTLGSYTLDTRNHTVTSPRGTFLLTPIQYNLLAHLMSRPGETFTPNRLLQEVWNYPGDTGSGDVVRTHIRNLRLVLEEDPQNPTFLITVPHHGYTISAIQ